MTTHGIQSAITLYDAGTYTLDQAARHAGQTPEAMVRTLRRYGVEARPADRGSLGPTAGAVEATGDRGPTGD